LNINKNLVYKVKQTGKHSFIFFLGSGAQSALNFILLPIITKNIIPSDYGIYSLVVMVGTMASSVFYLGGTSAMSRYYFEESEVYYRSKVFSTCFYLTLIGFIAQICVGFIFTKNISYFLFRSDQFSDYIFYMFIASGLGFLFNFLLLQLRVERRSILFSVSNILMFIVNFGTTYYLLDYLKLGFVSLIIGPLISNLIGTVILIIALRNLFIIKFFHDDLIEYLKFGIPAVVISLTAYLLDWLDRIVLNNHVSSADLGIYSFGCRIGLLISALYVQPFSMVWSSIRWEYAKDGDTSIFFALITKLYTFIGITAILSISLFLNIILRLLSKNIEYENAITIIPIIFLSQLIYGYSNILDFGIYLNKRLSIYIGIYLIGIIVNLILNSIFVPMYGFVIAAYSKLASFGICAILIYKISNNYFPISINLFLLSIPFVILISVVEIVLNIKMDILMQTGVNIILIIIISALNIIFLFNEKDRNIIKNISLQLFEQLYVFNKKTKD